MTIRQIAEKIEAFVENVGFYTIVNGKAKFPECDFAIADTDTEEMSEEDAEACKADASGWYGLHTPDLGFDSDDICIVCDYYGGGCAVLDQLFDGMNGMADVIAKTIIESISWETEVNEKTILVVEFEEGEE